MFRAIRLAVVVACFSAGAGYGSAVPNSHFPDSAFSDTGDQQSSLKEMFSKDLRELDEPVLFNDGNVRFGVRLTIATSNTGGAVVRVVQSKDGLVRGQVKRWHYTGVADEIPKNIRARSFSITQRDFDSLLADVENLHVWQLDNKQLYVGGSLWLLEVKSGDRYHVIYQVAAMCSQPVFVIGSKLLGLAKTTAPDRRPRDYTNCSWERSNGSR